MGEHEEAKQADQAQLESDLRDYCFENWWAERKMQGLDQIKTLFYSCYSAGYLEGLGRGIERGVIAARKGTFEAIDKVLGAHDRPGGEE